MYPDIIYQMSGGNRTQGDAIFIADSYDASGQIARGNYINYSGYAALMSGKLQNQP